MNKQYPSILFIFALNNIVSLQHTNMGGNMEKADQMDTYPDDKANVYNPSTFVHPKLSLVIPERILEKGKNDLTRLLS